MGLFGKSRTWQSVIFNDVITLGYPISREVRSVRGRGAPAWGFVDGTLKVVCPYKRPVEVALKV